jgi:hypothetical protein
MAPTHNSRTTQIAIRLELPTLERLNRMAEALAANAPPGLPVTLTGAHRAALLAGIEVLEARYPVAKGKPNPNPYPKMPGTTRR